MPYTRISKSVLSFILLFSLTLINSIPAPTLAATTDSHVNVHTSVNVSEIRFKVYPEKRHPSTGNWATIARFQLKRCSDNQTYKSFSNVVVNSNGEGVINVASNNLIEAGTYKVAIKGYSHLNQDFDCFVLNQNISLYFDLTQDNKFLLAGDTDASKDNRVTNADLSETTARLYTSNYNNDLNQDGKVNSLDLSILLYNFSKAGDP